MLELQTDTHARQDITDGRLSEDAAILDEKVKLDGGVDGQRHLSFDKDTADADVANARSVFAPSTTPVHRDTLGIINPLVVATRGKDLFFHDTTIPKHLIRPWTGPANALTP